MVSPDSSRESWPLGRVLVVFPGTDGRVRVAKVRVVQGTIVRSVTKSWNVNCRLHVSVKNKLSSCFIIHTVEKPYLSLSDFLLFIKEISLTLYYSFFVVVVVRCYDKNFYLL